MRLTWDEYFMNIASEVAARSTCARAVVGAILVREKRILATGYNGSVRGLDHCDDVGHMMVDGHCVRTVHAEVNAIIQAALHGVSTDQSTCYVTHLPCIQCVKALLNAGIIHIVYLEQYRPDENALSLIQQMGVQIDCIKGIYGEDDSDSAPRE